MEISGKVFIVTGGASGLGEGTARMLAANGAKVVIADLQEERGNAIAAELGQPSCAATSRRRPMAAASSRPPRALGKLIGLVNCAGIAPAARTVGKTGPHALDAVRQGRDGQPGRQLQHDPPGRRGDERRTSPNPPASAAC